MTSAKLLWIDLEMTGLEPDVDRILEVAAVATDWDFKPIATMTAVVKVDDSLIAERMIGEFWEENAAARDGLIAQNASGESAEAVEEKIIAFIDEHFDSDERVLLAGNSIHQDRKFINCEWPQLSRRLHYRMLDVSAWKVVFEGKFKKKFAKPEAHRALEDINGSIEELKYYLKKVK